MGIIILEPIAIPGRGRGGKGEKALVVKRQIWRMAEGGVKVG